MAQLFANAARTTLAAGISGTDTTLTLTLGDAFPVANTGAVAIGPGADWFKAVLDNGTAIEIVYVRTHTSLSETFSDVLRGQEGTTAIAWSAGTVVGLRVTALDATSAVMESGSFTPTVAGGTTAGVGTYSTQLGSYFKTGDLVFFSVALIYSAHTGTGTIQVHGLPFTSKNDGMARPVSLLISNMTFTNTPMASVYPNSTVAQLWTVASGGALTGLPMDTAASIYLSGCYQVA